jgi:PAS domain S-box-containing protein
VLKTKSFDLDNCKHAALLVIPVFILGIVIFYFLNIGTTSEPPYLVQILNTVFLGLVPVSVSIVAAKTFRVSGSLSVLFVSAGMLILGIGLTAAGWVLGLAGGQNISVTISNTSFFLLGALTLCAALIRIIYEPPVRPGSRTSNLAITFGAIFGFMAILFIAAIAGLTPAFFIPGAGMTVLREIVLANAVQLVALASILFFWSWTRTREDFFFWFSVSLGVFTVALISVSLANSVGGAFSWFGRIGLYTGSSLTLIAILVAQRKAHATGYSLQETIGRFFHEPEAAYRTLVETASEGIWSVDGEVKTVYVNRKMAEILGYSPEEMMGRSAFAFMDEEGIALAKGRLVDRAKGTGGSYEHKYIRKDGSAVWTLANVTPLTDGAGRFSGSFAMLTDITDRRLAEAEQKRLLETVTRNERTFSELIERAPYGIYIINSRFRVERANRVSQNGVFRNVKPLIGRDFDEVMRVLWPEEIARDITGHFHHTLETGEPFYSPRFTNQRNDIGIVESYEWELRRMTLPDGQFGVICYFFDSTEIRNAENALRQSEAKIKDALAEKEVLLAEIHHRVKNNLTAFISLLSLEGSYDDSPAGVAMKNDLQNRARSMALIHETLYRTHNFSKVDMKVYLSTLVDQVVHSYKSPEPVTTIIEADGITLDLARATPAGMIVNELVTNSLKYAFPASCDGKKARGSPFTIRINLVNNDGMFTMTVSDNGIGLPKEFDLTATRTLGLKLVNFLARHQMRAKVETHSSDGAEFRFRFRDDGK